MCLPTNSSQTGCCCNFRNFTQIRKVRICEKIWKKVKIFFRLISPKYYSFMPKKCVCAPILRKRAVVAIFEISLRSVRSGYAKKYGKKSKYFFVLFHLNITHSYLKNVSVHQFSANGSLLQFSKLR